MIFEDSERAAKPLLRILFFVYRGSVSKSLHFCNRFFLFCAISAILYASSEAKRKETGTMPLKLAHIGDRLKALREEQYLSQRELAKAARVSPTTIFKLEANQTEPQPRTIRKLAGALGISPAQLAPRD